MTSNTKSIIRQVLASDVTATEDEKKVVESALKGNLKRDEPPEVPRYLTYREAASKLRKSVSRVRQLVAEKRLVPVRLGPNRASGVTEESVLAIFR